MIRQASYIVYILFITHLFAASSPAFAQDGISVDISIRDSSVYIIDKSDLLSIKVYPIAKYNSLEIHTPNDKISMLTKIEDQAIIEAIQQEACGTSPTFSDHLQRMTARFKSVKPGAGRT